MRTLLATFAIVFASAAHAEPPTLLGQWKSDGPRTMAYVRENTKLDDRMRRGLEPLLSGGTTLTFSGTTLQTEMPDILMGMSAAQDPSSRISAQQPYQVLGATETQIAVSSIDVVLRRPYLMVFNFIGKDTMWVYKACPWLPDANFREYFVRVK